MGKKVYTDQLNGVQSEIVRTRVFPIAKNRHWYWSFIHNTIS